MATMINDYLMQPGGAFAQRLNHDKTHGPVRSTHVNLYVLILVWVYSRYRVLNSGVIGLGTGMRGRRAREREIRCMPVGQQVGANSRGIYVQYARRRKGGWGGAGFDSRVCSRVRSVLQGGDGDIYGSWVSWYNSGHIIFITDRTGDLSPLCTVCLRRISTLLSSRRQMPLGEGAHKVDEQVSGRGNRGAEPASRRHRVLLLWGKSLHIVGALHPWPECPHLQAGNGAAVVALCGVLHRPQQHIDHRGRRHCHQHTAPRGQAASGQRLKCVTGQSRGDHMYGGDFRGTSGRWPGGHEFLLPPKAK